MRWTWPSTMAGPSSSRASTADYRSAQCPALLKVHGFWVSSSDAALRIMTG
jgi:hypothetical protein